MPTLRALVSILSLGLLVGCAQPSRRPLEESSLAGLERAEKTAQSARAPGEARSDTPAMVLGEPVSWSDLHAYLAEAGGSAALEELALDRVIAKESRERGVGVTPADVERESALLEEFIQSEAQVGEGERALAVQRVRSARGLGPKRFAALIERNAALRKLVAAEVSVDPMETESLLDVLYGERFRARIIVVSSERQASSIRERLAALPEQSLPAAFSGEAMAFSSDASASAGGLLPEFAVSAPGVPRAIAAAVDRLGDGQMSPTIALDNSFAVVLVEKRTPAREATPKERSDAERLIRVRKERVAMDRLARDLVKRAGVTTLDDSLRWSWSNGWMQRNPR